MERNEKHEKDKASDEDKGEAKNRPSQTQRQGKTRLKCIDFLPSA
jgi:hypothetical protein